MREEETKNSIFVRRRHVGRYKSQREEREIRARWHGREGEKVEKGEDANLEIGCFSGGLER